VPRILTVFFHSIRTHQLSFPSARRGRGKSYIRYKISLLKENPIGGMTISMILFTIFPTCYAVVCWY